MANNYPITVDGYKINVYQDGKIQIDGAQPRMATISSSGQAHVASFVNKEDFDLYSVVQTALQTSKDVGAPDFVSATLRASTRKLRPKDTPSFAGPQSPDLQARTTAGTGEA